MATTSRTSLSLLIAGGLAAALLPVTAMSATASSAPAASAPAVSSIAVAAKAKKAKLSLSDTTLKVGDKTKVKGTRYPKGFAQLFVAICASPPTAGNCDHSPDHLKLVSKAAGDRKFKTKFKVKATKFKAGSGTINCKKRQCVIGTVKAGAFTDRSYQATKKFSVR